MLDVEQHYLEVINRFSRATRCLAFFDAYINYVNQKVDTDYRKSEATSFSLLPTDFLTHLSEISYNIYIVDICSLLEEDIKRKKDHKQDPLNLFTLLESASENLWVKETKIKHIENLKQLKNTYNIDSLKLIRNNISHGTYLKDFIFLKQETENSTLLCWSIWNSFLTYFPYHKIVKNTFNYDSYLNNQISMITNALEVEFKKILISPKDN